MKDLLNCPNCGAPIVDDRCAYCGSVFLDVCGVEPGTIVYLKFHPKQDKVAYVRSRVNTLSFDLDPSIHDVIGHNGRIVVAQRTFGVVVNLSLMGEMDKQGRVIIYKEDLPHA